MHVERTRQIESSEPDECGMHDYCYEYDIYHFSVGSSGLVARSYTDTPNEAHLLKIEENGSQRLITRADLAHPLFRLAQDYLRQEGKVHLSWLSGKGNGYEPLPGAPPDAARRFDSTIRAAANFIHPRSFLMKIASTLFGSLLALVGIVWILQGVNVLPGSFMTGQLQWAAYGAIALVVGCVLLYVGRRGGRKPGVGR